MGAGRGLCPAGKQTSCVQRAGHDEERPPLYNVASRYQLLVLVLLICLPSDNMQNELQHRITNQNIPQRKSRKTKQRKPKHEVY